MLGGIGLLTALAPAAAALGGFAAGSLETILTAGLAPAGLPAESATEAFARGTPFPAPFAAGAFFENFSWADSSPASMRRMRSRRYDSTPIMKSVNGMSLSNPEDRIFDFPPLLASSRDGSFSTLK